jgi:DNA helicase II / ATP-dependent DNA helicase PcrA
VNLFDEPQGVVGPDLNPQQEQAAAHLEGPALVLAGAGSGKTRVLTTRIARLVRDHGVPSHRILSVTFTNKAAGEMRARVQRLLGDDPRGMWLGTFHALGARFLRRHASLLGWDAQFTIFDSEQSLREIKRIQDAQGVDPARWKPQALRSAISEAKNQLIGPEAFVTRYGDGFDLFMRMVARVYPAYQRALRDQNAFDFDDLLVAPVRLLEGDAGVLRTYQERFAFILVDEYQDTNHAQFRLLQLLASHHRNLMVVGDEDQAIYGWRGADIRNILDFESTFPGARVIRLEQNYRSTANILAAANQVIRKNTERKEKTLRTDREEGDLLQVVETADERDEALWIAEEIRTRARDSGLAYEDVAVLYRTNAQSRALEDAFRRFDLPYQIVGGVRFYERREIQDILAYLRLISNPRDTAAFQRVVNVPRRGIGKTSQDRFLQWASENEMSAMEALHHLDRIPELPAGARKALSAFAELIQGFAEQARHVSVGVLLEGLLDRLDYESHLRAEGPEGEDRINNVRELLAGALEFDGERLGDWDDEPIPEGLSDLDLFLQRTALTTDLDQASEGPAVLLMTLHNAKGLEFPVVFLAGLEEGLFPLGRSYDDPSQLEEERRLFYVGLTRAEDRLFLSWARTRRRAGEFMVGMLSSFVRDVDTALLTVRRSPRVERESVGFGASTGFGLSAGGSGRDRSRPGSASGRSSGGRASDTGRAATDSGQNSRSSRSSWVPSDLEDSGFNQDQPRLVPGERVAHASFGSGTVTQVSGFGQDLKVTVQFDDIGEKRLLARYARLERALE